MYPENTVLDNKGAVLGHQAMNDNLTTVEQINRTMLGVVTLSAQRLTNDKHVLDTIVMSGAYDDEKLATLASAVETLKASLDSAMAEFEKSINFEETDEG